MQIIRRFYHPRSSDIKQRPPINRYQRHDVPHCDEVRMMRENIGELDRRVRYLEQKMKVPENYD